MAEPPVAVVVATYNRNDRLAALVAALEAQEDVEGFEVVFVDDASSDQTWAELKRLAASSRLNMITLRLDRNRGPGAARNAGWLAASAPVIAFTDDDCLPQPQWLRHLLDALAGADMAQGRTLPNPAHEARIGPFSHTRRIGGKGYYETCNIAYRRDLLTRLGGFDERFYYYSEDLDLGLRAERSGARWAHARHALVYHEVRPSSYRAHLREVRRLDGAVLLLARHPDMRQRLHWNLFFRPSHPPAMLAAAGLAVGALLRRSRAGRTLAVPLIGSYVWDRVRVHPLPGRRRRRLAAIPAALVADLLEVAALTRASARHRTLML